MTLHAPFLRSDLRKNHLFFSIPKILPGFETIIKGFSAHQTSLCFGSKRPDDFSYLRDLSLIRRALNS